VDGSGLCPPTTLYIGNYFQWTSSGNTKYYYHGSQQLAMRRTGYPSGNGLFFTLRDHGVCASANKGSTVKQNLDGSMPADHTGRVLYNKRSSSAWGEVRHASGGVPTDQRYTGILPPFVYKLHHAGYLTFMLCDSDAKIGLTRSHMISNVAVNKVRR
jgi:hypothetical protein